MYLTRGNFQAHLKLAGFTLQSHDSRLFSECGKGDFWLSSVRGFARLIPALSILPEQEGKVSCVRCVDLC